MTVPQAPNQRWSLDFVSDVLAHGRRFRALVVVDDFTRGVPGARGRHLLSGRRVARELDQIIEPRGRPLMIVSDCCDPRDFLQVKLEFGPQEGPDHEAIEIFRGADHRRAARAGSRHADGRCLP